MAVWITWLWEDPLEFVFVLDLTPHKHLTQQAKNNSSVECAQNTRSGGSLMKRSAAVTLVGCWPFYATRHWIENIFPFLFWSSVTNKHTDWAFSFHSWFRGGVSETKTGWQITGAGERNDPRSAVGSWVIEWGRGGSCVALQVTPEGETLRPARPG